jgi:hypothetical protein
MSDFHKCYQQQDDELIYQSIDKVKICKKILHNLKNQENPF